MLGEPAEKTNLIFAVTSRDPDGMGGCLERVVPLTPVHRARPPGWAAAPLSAGVPPRTNEWVTSSLQRIDGVFCLLPYFLSATSSLILVGVRCRGLDPMMLRRHEVLNSTQSTKNTVITAIKSCCIQGAVFSAKRSSGARLRCGSVAPRRDYVI